MALESGVRVGVRRLAGVRVGAVASVAVEVILGAGEIRETELQADNTTVRKRTRI
jgi:hypothetical protein